MKLLPLEDNYLVWEMCMLMIVLEVPIFNTQVL